MKTVGDIAAYLKRSGLRLEVMYDGRVYTARSGIYKQTSKYLDDALENLSEEIRREASGVGAMRDGSFTATSTPLPNASYQNYFVTTQVTPPPQAVTALCGNVTVAGGTCPVCNRLPILSRLGVAWMGCMDFNHPMWSIQPGVSYVVDCAGKLSRLTWDSVMFTWV